MHIRSLGRIGYREALRLQEDLVAQRSRDEIPDTLLLCEHDAVYTLGRSTSPESLPQDDPTERVEISRGGDITWHGPGQLVGYWIRKLVGADRDLHAHLRLLEEGLIQALAHFGIEGRREPGKTGVWVDDKKVASIGVAVRSWVTFHGFALNVAVDPEVWFRFRPCGLEASVMSDLRGGAHSVGFEDVASRCGEVFATLGAAG